MEANPRQMRLVQALTAAVVVLSISQIVGCVRGATEKEVAAAQWRADQGENRAMNVESRVNAMHSEIQRLKLSCRCSQP